MVGLNGKYVMCQFVKGGRGFGTCTVLITKGWRQCKGFHFYFVIDKKTISKHPSKYIMDV